MYVCIICIMTMVYLATKRRNKSTEEIAFLEQIRENLPMVRKSALDSKIRGGHNNKTKRRRRRRRRV
jgi:hypothetical protein